MKAKIDRYILWMSTLNILRPIMKKSYSGSITINNPNARQVLRFTFVGVLDTAVDFGSFMFLIKVLGIHYTFSQIGGYSTGILYSFI